MDTKIEHKIKMVDMLCSLLAREKTFTPEFRVSCLTQLREQLTDLQDDLCNLDTDFMAFWEILEAFEKSKPYLFSEQH